MNKLNITLIIALLPCFLSAQNYLSKERENEIKISGKYYWDECSDFNVENARQCALTALSQWVIEDAVNQSRKQEEVLKAIEMGAHFDNLQQEGKIKILAWISRDSVFITTQKPITKIPISQPTPQSETIVPKQPVKAKTTVDNPVLQELAACKNYNDVRRVAIINGFVRGGTINSSEGFGNPEKCIIAVFTNDGTLAALLDTGGSSRTDLLSGKTVQNPEQHYKNSEYNLWYLQEKK